jgi:hypothetical protein
MCDKREEELTEINEFFEREETISLLLQKFWDSYVFNQMISDTYAEFNKEIEGIQNNVPSQLKNDADSIWRDMKFTRDSFAEEVKEKFKIFLYLSITQLNPNRDFFYYAVQKIFFENNYKLAVEEAKNLAKALSSFYVSNYFKTVYAGYVPDGMTSQQTSMIRMLSGGGIIVPITSIFPEWFKN